MSKYKEFDEEVLQEIRQGNKTFSIIVARLKEIAKPFAKKDCKGHYEVDRVIDKRLQALRKSGKIRYEKGHWELTQ